MIPAVPRPNPVKVETRQLAALKESSQAYARASSLDVTVAQHIQSVPGQHVGLTSVVRQQASTESNQALALFKNAQTARLAIIASVVLGPPKSLQG
jgi:type IV secretory pathway VirJ component